MRIALVSLHTSPLAQPGSGDAGGMNVYLVALADALAEAGHQVELFTRDAGEAPDAGGVRSTPGGVPVRFIAAGPRHPVAKGELPGIAAEFGRALARRPRFDVVHAHYWLSGVAAREAAVAWRAPLVLSLHTVAAMKNAALAPGDRAEPAARLDAERALVRDAALVVTATEAELRAVLGLGADVASDRVVVLTPGVDTTLFHPDAPAPEEQAPDGAAPDGRAPTARPVVAARPLVLVLARLQPLKGVELALDAVDRIPLERRPRLVVAGGASPGHESYAADLAARADPAWVRFLPAQPRAAVAALLREAAILLIPSHSETFGLVALEAAASGVPVIAARTGGLAEAVLEGRTGVLVEGRDPARWAAALDELLHDPARYAALARAARDHALAHSWPATAERLVQLYRDAAR